MDCVRWTPGKTHFSFLAAADKLKAHRQTPAAKAAPEGVRVQLDRVVTNLTDMHGGVSPTDRMYATLSEQSKAVLLHAVSNFRYEATTDATTGLLMDAKAQGVATGVAGLQLLLDRAQAAVSAGKIATAGWTIKDLKPLRAMEFALSNADRAALPPVLRAFQTALQQGGGTSFRARLALQDGGVDDGVAAPGGAAAPGEPGTSSAVVASKPKRSDAEVAAHNDASAAHLKVMNQFFKRAKKQ